MTRDKKNIITEPVLNILTHLKNQINRLLGFHEGTPQINYGPCGVFAQLFYCLKGQLLIQLKDHEITLSEQEGYTIAPGAAHQVSNNFSETAHFIVISSPDSHADRVDLE